MVIAHDSAPAHRPLAPDARAHYLDYSGVNSVASAVYKTPMWRIGKDGGFDLRQRAASLGGRAMVDRALPRSER